MKGTLLDMSEQLLAYFTHEGNRFVPRQYARNPWTPLGLHGRFIAALVAREIEIKHGHPDFQFNRLTTDLFRMPPLAPVEVQTRSVREGNRVRVADGVVLADGKEVGRASAVMLRKGPNPPGEVWSPPVWSVPHPDSIPKQEYSGDRGWNDPIQETRIIHGKQGDVTQKRIWLRDHGQLVEGEDISPFVRAAMASDYTNPLVNSGSHQLGFVNADITLYLHRDPIGEWMGFESASQHIGQGMAVAEATLYDLTGPFGQSTVCSVADLRVQEGRN